MSQGNYERLSATDTSFLILEKPSTPLHISATLLYESGPFATRGSGIDIEAYKAAIEAVLHRIPRYRQKLQWIPGVGHPVWVDDEEFNLDYHIRHTRLPRPGSMTELKRLSARIMAQSLDKTKPLWEAWVVEGMEGGCFAVIHKIHHCMIDGLAGRDLVQILHSTSPSITEPEEPQAFMPRPTPGAVDLLRDEIARYLGVPARAARGLREAVSEISELGSEITTRALSILGAVQNFRDAPSRTPLNEPIGPHRRFDWLEMDLSAVRAIRKAVGCTINDVVLTIVSGAVREFLLGRGQNLAGLDFRIAAPVSVRAVEDEPMRSLISQWIVKAPIQEPGPLERLEKIRDITDDLRTSDRALDADLIMAAAEWTPTVLLSLASRSASGAPPYNMMVTNVPGPQYPLYLLGARLLSQYSQMPIADETALGIALVSYDGKLCWGFNADYDLVPDLDVFTKLIDASFYELARASGITFDLDD
jgi:WS/DGAT/MGAT family acyltransferase